MINRYGGPERRRAKRVNASFIVIYRVQKPLQVFMVVGNRDISAIMLDLSESGMAIATKYDIAAATTLLIKFTLINPHALNDAERIHTMEISASVKNNLMLSNNEQRLGIQFEQIRPEDKAAITHFIHFSAKNPL